VIDGDAFAPGLNYVFGQARLPGRVAFIALARLRDSFRGRPENDVRFRERAVKVAVHELGHTFGFVHCDRTTCVMHFANSFLDVDRQSARYENETVPQ
jgi:archaemetzincin